MAHQVVTVSTAPLACDINGHSEGNFLNNDFWPCVVRDAGHLLFATTMVQHRQSSDGQHRHRGQLGDHQGLADGEDSHAGNFAVGVVVNDDGQSPWITPS